MITMEYQLELRQLRYFLVLAEELHFRNAAAILYISQPGLSRQIKELELHIGVTLFHRTNRKVALTKAGLYLKTELNKTLSTIDHHMTHAKRLHDGADGDLILGYVGSAMQKIIPDLLVAFRKDLPHIHFTLKEMDNQDQVDKLLDGSIDIGFVRLTSIPRNLNSVLLLKEPFCLVLPSDHPLDQASFVSMLQVKDDPFILFDPAYSPSYYAQVMQIFHDSGYSPIISHNTIHSDSIYKLVENGFGISIVPISLQQPHMKEVKYILLDSVSQRTSLSLIWNPDSINPLVVKLVGKALKSADVGLY